MNYYKEVESLINQNEINKGVRALQDNSDTLEYRKAHRRSSRW